MKLNLILFLFLILSGLYLIQVTHESRRLFAQIETEQKNQRDLEVALDKLQVEKRSQATPLRIEKVARERLRMNNASANVTSYVTYNLPSTSKKSSQSPASTINTAAAPHSHSTP